MTPEVSEQGACGYGYCTAQAAHKQCPIKLRGWAWSPVDFGANERVRANDNVLAITAAVFDLDHLSPAQLGEVAQALQSYQYLAHSTHGHREHDICIRVVVPLTRQALASEWRTVLAQAVKLLGIPADPSCKDLSRLYFLPVTIRGLPAIAERNEGKSLDVDALLAADASSRQSTLPVPVPQTAVLAHASAIDAVPLSKGLLASPALSACLETPSDSEEDTSEATDLASLRKRLRMLRTRYKRAEDPRFDVLNRMLLGEALAPPASKPGDEGQSGALHKLASILGAALPANCPTDAAIELMRSSIMAMGAGSEGFDHWFDRARFSYDRSMEKRIARDLETQATNEAIKQRILSQFGGIHGHTDNDRAASANHAGLGAGVQAGGVSNVHSLHHASNGNGNLSAGVSDGLGSGTGAELADAQRTNNVPADSSGVPNHLSIPTPSPSVTAEVDHDAWKSHLIWNDDENGLKNCGANVATILYYSRETKGTFRFNEVTKKIEIHGGLFGAEPFACLDVAVSNYLSSPAWGLNMKPRDTGDQIAYVARSNAYDPLLDYLRSLKWDGTPRCDTWLETYLGAITIGADGQDVTPYLRSIGPKWLISAAARALYPGCKVDTVLVTEGLQGALKSTAFGVLGGEFFSDTAIVLGDKDSRMMAAASWIIELAELVSFRRQEVDAQKAFFTSKADRIRPPYGRSIEEFWRRCVFVGTTNNDDYLHDPTGNRRYWPLRCGKVDIDGLARDRDQLWAEAVARLDAGTLHARDCTCYRKSTPGHFVDGLWWFADKAEEAAAAEIAAERMYDSALAARIPQWWYSLVPGNRPALVRTGDVAMQALGIAIERVNRQLEKEITSTLRKMGFKRSREALDGIRQWCYVPSQALLEAAQSKGNVNRTHLAIVPKTENEEG